MTKVSINCSRSKNEIPALFIGLLLLIMISLLLLLYSQEGLGITLFFVYILLALVVVKYTQLSICGNCLRVNDRNFPNLKQVIEKQAKDAVIPEPSLYVTQDPYPNAYCIGFRHPYTIVVHSSLIESCTQEEVEGIIAHEVGHAVFGHPKLSTVLFALQSSAFSFFYLPVIWIFNIWQRATEYTADRCSVVLIGNPRHQVTALIKLHTGPKFFDQIDEEALLNQSIDLNRSIHGTLAEFLFEHPFLVNRISSILSFAKENHYTYRDGSIVFCENCGLRLEKSAMFCEGCGHPIA